MPLLRLLGGAFARACLAFSSVWVLGCQSMSVPPPPSASPPITIPTVAPTLTYFVYHVRRGDTLYSLGERFRLPWREIADTNGVWRPDQMKVGTPLLIRQVQGVAPPSASEPPERATVERQSLSKHDLHRGKPSASFWWPTSGRVVRHYGNTLRGLAEPGITIVAPRGRDVCAVSSGKVIECLSAGRTSESGWGNVVVVAHSAGMVSWYAHLDKVLVTKGQAVTKGEPIGTVGSTGAAGSPQLAFRMFKNERPLDPEKYLP